MAQSNTINGRRYHDVTDASMLPNECDFVEPFFSSETMLTMVDSDIEHKRLDVQSNATIALMGGKPFHAPVSNPKRIVDIGCGTGAMTRLLAKAYPNAHVIGLDLSAVPEDQSLKLDNLEFVQGDIRQILKEGKDPRFQPKSFDYVYERFLLCGITDWATHISAVATFVKQGGWFEAQEVSMNFQRRDGTFLSEENWSFWPRWIADAKAQGLDVEIGHHIEVIVLDCGQSDDIEVTPYKLPLDSRPRPETDGFGDKFWPSLLGGIRMTCMKTRSEEEVEENTENVRALIAAGFQEGDGHLLCVVTGRKKLE